MPAPTIVWRHYSAVADGFGVASVQSGNDVGTHAVQAGGFATAGSSSDSDESWTESHGEIVPAVGSYIAYNPDNDTTSIVVQFQATPGASVRCHVWCVVA